MNNDSIKDGYQQFTRRSEEKSRLSGLDDLVSFIRILGHFEENSYSYYVKYRRNIILKIYSRIIVHFIIYLIIYIER